MLWIGQYEGADPLLIRNWPVNSHPHQTNFFREDVFSYGCVPSFGQAKTVASRRCIWKRGPFFAGLELLFSPAPVIDSSLLAGSRTTTVKVVQLLSPVIMYVCVLCFLLCHVACHHEAFAGGLEFCARNIRLHLKSHPTSRCLHFVVKCLWVHSLFCFLAQFVKQIGKSWGGPRGKVKCV